ncbi:MAG: hypothetical protein ACR2NU_12430 [Aeoliella sp.]
MTNITTTVRRLRRFTFGWAMVDGKLRLATLIGVLASCTASAQQPTVHALHAGVMPPGAIGSQRLLRGGPLSGYTQPAEIRVPSGVQVGIAQDGQFTDPELDNPVVGLLIGPVYRFRVANIFDHAGVEVFPTVELIDRLYPPPGHALRFPVPIEFTAEDLDLAARGMYVTRVIYVEDPGQALPVGEVAGQMWFEAGDGEDPLEVADRAGRPIAILRLGGRDLSQGGDSSTLTYGCPPIVEYGRKPSAE